jgi:hypothetical protein
MPAHMHLLIICLYAQTGWRRQERSLVILMRAVFPRNGPVLLAERAQAVTPRNRCGQVVLGIPVQDQLDDEGRGAAVLRLAQPLAGLRVVILVERVGVCGAPIEQVLAERLRSLVVAMEPEWSPMWLSVPFLQQGVEPGLPEVLVGCKAISDV